MRVLAICRVFSDPVMYYYYICAFIEKNKGVTEAQSGSELGNEAPSDNKLSDLTDRDDDLLKLGTQSDTKQSILLEGDNVLLKPGNLEADQPIAKKRLHSSLDSVPSKRMKETIPFKQKGKHFTLAEVCTKFNC